MLARRLTIICLLVMLFGMGLSALVAKVDRSARDRTDTALACVYSGAVCPSSWR